MTSARDRFGKLVWWRCRLGHVSITHHTRTVEDFLLVRDIQHGDRTPFTKYLVVYYALSSSFRLISILNACDTVSQYEAALALVRIPNDAVPSSMRV